MRVSHNNYQDSHTFGSRHRGDGTRESMFVLLVCWYLPACYCLLQLYSLVVLANSNQIFSLFNHLHNEDEADYEAELIAMMVDLDAVDLDTLRNKTKRSSRFPSIEQRIQLYMSTWYCHHPDSHLDSIHYQYDKKKQHQYQWQKTVKIAAKGHAPVQADSQIRPDTLILLDPFVVEECAKLSPFGDDVSKSDYIKYAEGMVYYCQDFLEFLNYTAPSSPPHLLITEGVPLLASFGDRPTPGGIPTFTKARSAIPSNKDPTKPACSKKAKERDHHHGIILRLNRKRHYEHVPTVPMIDIPWGQKKNMAVFRGVSTGANLVLDLGDAGWGMDDTAKCLMIPRCHAVLNNMNSTLVDAKLNQLTPPGFFRGGGNLTSPDGTVTINVLDEKRMEMVQQLQYKGLIMLEGNDVATGLKWALYSKSVVLMPTPTRTSWAMEELLVPWKHYIPIQRDGSDAEEKMQWVIDNDLKAQEIANHATLWIEDLMYHPDAESDDQMINQEILKRYLAFFVQQWEYEQTAVDFWNDYSLKTTAAQS